MVHFSAEVVSTHLSGDRVRIEVPGRTFLVDRRDSDRSGAGFCPLELVAGSLGA